METSVDKLIRLASSGDVQVVELHGVKGAPGYSLLHSPNKGVRDAANKVFKDKEAKGLTAAQAQKDVGGSLARVKDVAARLGGGKNVHETGVADGDSVDHPGDRFHKRAVELKRMTDAEKQKNDVGYTVGSRTRSQPSSSVSISGLDSEKYNLHRVHISVPENSSDGPVFDVYKESNGRKVGRISHKKNGIHVSVPGSEPSFHGGNRTLAVHQAVRKMHKREKAVRKTRPVAVPSGLNLTDAMTYIGRAI